MFFFGIFGIQDRERIIKEFDAVICPSCGRLSRAELIEIFTYFHFFFIPIFQWNRRYFVRYRCCPVIYSVEKEYAEELKRGAILDPSRLHKVFGHGSYCPECGSYIDPSFNFCPFCGRKLN
ncbi:MAG: zinc ribbon domain-containing protein [Thermosediminibacteraceae bacterium]|nr:zinc ribbon domain-containing protein [Thermosediminibacteraceae bacterium]